MTVFTFTFFASWITMITNYNPETSSQSFSEEIISSSHEELAELNA